MKHVKKILFIINKEKLLIQIIPNQQLNKNLLHQNKNKFQNLKQ